MTSETRYLRNAGHTVNGLTANELLITNTATATLCYLADGPGDPGAITNFDVIKRGSGGAEIVIGSAVASAATTAEGGGPGLVSATWACPETALVSSNAVKVVARISHIGNGTSTTLNFITNQAAAWDTGVNKLTAATWTFHRWTIKFTTEDFFESDIYYGSAAYPSRITNFSWDVGSTIPMGLFFNRGV